MKVPTIDQVLVDFYPITVWQALSLLSTVRDGVAMTEARARKVLRSVGMKKSEMDEPYPEEAMGELYHLLKHPEDLDKRAEKAGKWMIKRN